MNLILIFLFIVATCGFAEAGVVAERVMTLQNGLEQPSDVSVRSNGDAYVLDGVNGRVAVFDSQGRFEFFFGQKGSGDGELELPMGIYVEGDTVYVADTGNHRIAVFDRQGNFIRNIKLINGNTQKLSPQPSDILVDEGVAIWSDRKNHQVCRNDIKSGRSLGCFGKKGEEKGAFWYPFSLALNRDGYIHVADVLNGRVQYFNSKGERADTISGFGILPGELFRPNGIAVDENDNLFVTDAYTRKVSVFQNGGFTGMMRMKGGEELIFDVPVGMALWKDRIYVTDMGKNRVEVFRLTFEEEEGKVAVGSGITSQKDCIICHLSWNPNFQSVFEKDRRHSDTGLLPEVLPSLCYSCHNGAIVDSRSVIEKGNQHPDINHRSKERKRTKDALPKEFPLIEGELYCGSCHSPHNWDGGNGSIVAGGNPWMRVSNKDKDLCQKCHTSKLDSVVGKKRPRRGINHPIGITLSPPPDGEVDKGLYPSSERLQKGLPDELTKRGAFLDGKDRLVCQSCHVVHGAEGDRLTLIKNGNGELCLSCHEGFDTVDVKDAIVKGIHPVGIKMDKPVKIGNTEVSEVTCLTCHSIHDGRENTPLLRKEFEDGDICTPCHERHTPRDREDARKKGIHPVNTRLARPVNIRGKEFADVKCLTCHSIHKGVKGTPAVALEYKDGELCDNCHKGKKRVMGSKHDMRITAKEGKNRLNESPDVSGGCGGCHTLHRGKGDIPFLFAGGWENFSGVERLLPKDRPCFDCHRNKGIGEKKVVRKYTHPGMDLVLMSSTSILPLFDKYGKRSEFGEIRCATCHDPHGWSPTPPNPLFSKEGEPNKNTEGNVLNSFLRRKGVKGTFCINCHGLETMLKYKYFHDVQGRDKGLTYVR